jgi:hypothetical protein
MEMAQSETIFAEQKLKLGLCEIKLTERARLLGLDTSDYCDLQG